MAPLVDLADLNKENRETWTTNASAWDSGQGHRGNYFQNEHVYPATEKLLSVPGARVREVLELGCGNGAFARRLAAYGAADHILATDFSEGQLHFARERTPTLNNAATGSTIQYDLLDATDEKGIEALGKHRFDYAVSNMMLMDMPDPGAMFRGLRHVLKPGGCVVLSLMHPVFNTERVRGFEKGRDGGEPWESTYIKVESYLTAGHSFARSTPGQPMPNLNWHRPLHEIMGHLFASGFVVDGFEEPAVTAPEPAPADEPVMRRIMWYPFTREFPFTVVIRARVPSIGP